MHWGVLLLLVALPGCRPMPARAMRNPGPAIALPPPSACARRSTDVLPPIARATTTSASSMLTASVYFGAPTSTKADPSAVAVAETLVEMGRRFEDDKILNKAIAQYKFLRKEYPGSKYRCDALFTIGEIYKDDLNDPEQARACFRSF